MLIEPWDTLLARRAGADHRPHQGRRRPARPADGVRRRSTSPRTTDGEPADPRDVARLPGQPGTNSETAILRRGYSFVDGSDGLGRLDAGLFFIAYQRDPETGFVQVQRNLRLDAMNEYIRHTSSALFACPPGVRDADDWWGRTLFAG